MLPGFNKFYQVLPGFTRFYQVLPGFTRFTRFNQVLPGFTRFYQVLPGFTRFYQVLPGVTGFYQVYQVLTVITRFQMCLLQGSPSEFTDSTQVLLLDNYQTAQVTNSFKILLKTALRLRTPSPEFFSNNVFLFLPEIQ